MTKQLPFLSSKVCCSTLALLLSAAWLGASDHASYAGIKPDEFMRNWLVLKSIPVSAEKSGEPAEEVQKKAFAEDSLNGQGGEAKARPQSGLKQMIGERELKWESVQSRSDVIDLKAGTSPSDYAIAYAWELITSPEWYGIPKERLYVTVFGGAEVSAGTTLGVDEEAKKYWLEQHVAADAVQVGDGGGQLVLSRHRPASIPKLNRRTPAMSIESCLGPSRKPLTTAVSE